MCNQDNILCLINLSNLSTCLLDNVVTLLQGSYMLITSESERDINV